MKEPIGTTGEIQNVEYHTYSLWLVPSRGSTTFDRLASEMKAWAQINGTANFLPHVTLASYLKGEEGIIVAKSCRLARTLEVFSFC
jgi:hypothetical protein